MAQPLLRLSWCRLVEGDSVSLIDAASMNMTEIEAWAVITTPLDEG